MPKNIKELIEMVDTAVTAKVMSRKTGTEKLENAGFIPDAAMEIERLQEEATEDLQGATL
jgi:hypothetical protein